MDYSKNIIIIIIIIIIILKVRPINEIISRDDFFFEKSRILLIETDGLIEVHCKDLNKIVRSNSLLFPGIFSGDCEKIKSICRYFIHEAAKKGDLNFLK